MEIAEKFICGYFQFYKDDNRLGSVGLKWLVRANVKEMRVLSVGKLVETKA